MDYFVREVKSLLGLIFNFSYDLIRYWKYAFNYRKCNIDHYVAEIWINMHSIEKGLSMTPSKPGFGRKVVEKLIVLLLDYKSRHFDENQIVVWSALGALEQYLLMHDVARYDLGELKEKIKNVLISYQDLPRTGGIEKLSRTDIQKAAKGDFRELVSSRHSIRQFTSEPVAKETLQEAIWLAQRTPSVCNRQPWRVYVCMEKEKIKHLVQLQGGSKGFAETAPCFLIITSDVASFGTSAERKEAYIDGGLFSMSLIHALHYLGLAVCPLNWCKNCFVDRRFRKEFKLKDSEEIIMLLAVGNMPDEFYVPQSKRELPEKVIKALTGEQQCKAFAKFSL